MRSRLRGLKTTAKSAPTSAIDEIVVPLGDAPAHGH